MFTTIASCLVLQLTAHLNYWWEEDKTWKCALALLVWVAFRDLHSPSLFINLVWKVKFQYKVTNFVYIIFPV